MASVEERVSYLEGKVEEQSRSFTDLRGLIGGLDAKIDRLDARLDQRTDRIEQRIDVLDQKVSRQFLWLAGVQLTTLLAIIGFLSR